jgi:cyclopropane-fatty-acyl-phospholipid synthase
LARAAEGLFFIEGMENDGPHYDRTLLAWEENVRRAWPRFAERFEERFRRMWCFYLLSCAGAFRARGLQDFQILFATEKAVEGNLRPAEIPAAYSSAGRLPNEPIPIR